MISIRPCFTNQLELIGDLQTSVVFTYLFTKHLEYFTKSSYEWPAVPYSFQQMSSKLLIDRDSLKKAMHRLEDLHLIHFGENLCYVESEYFVQVQILYSHRNYKVKEKVKQAFLKNDTRTLHDMVVDFHITDEDVYKTIAFMSGIPFDDVVRLNHQRYSF